MIELYGLLVYTKFYSNKEGREFESQLGQTNTCRYLAWHSALQGRANTGLLSIRRILQGGKSGHGTGSLASMWGSTIKLP